MAPIPALDLNGPADGSNASLDYIENHPAALIAPDAVLSHQGGGQFEPGRLTVTIAAGSADDRLSIMSQGGGDGEIGVSGDTILYGGRQIGTYSGGDGSLSPLVVLFNPDATLPAVEALIRRIAFSNPSDDPSGVDREIELRLGDADGTVADPVGATITVTQVNDAPNVSGFADDSVTYVEGSTWVRLDQGGNALVSDADPFGLSSDRVGSGFTRPVFTAELPDGSGRIVVVEKAGLIRILDPDTGEIDPTPFLDVRSEVLTTGELGLLGFTFAPDAAATGTFYVYLTNLSGDIEVRRYQPLAGNRDQADPASADVVLLIDRPAPSNHVAGWIGFGPDGNLYVTVGDGTVSANAQSLETLLGKVLRIDPSSDQFPTDPTRDYAIPAGNPFAGATAGLDEIFAYGLRNPFRAGFDPLTGHLYVGDVGEEGFEEINLIPAGVGGLNFGWPVREGTAEFRGPDSPAFTPPATEYPHGVGPAEGASVIAGFVYHGPIAALDGQLVFGDFNSQLWSLPPTSLVLGSTLPNSNFNILEVGLLPPPQYSIDLATSFSKDSAGNLYITDLTGEIFRVQPSSAPNFAAGRLTVSITANEVASEDRLGIDTSGAVQLSAGATANSVVRVDGAIVGHILPGATGVGGQDLTILFSSGADSARVSTLLRAISYANDNTIAPTPGSRTITFTLVDGAGVENGGMDRAEFTSVVTVTPTDDAPTTSDDAASVAEDATVTIRVLDNDADPDGPSLSVNRINDTLVAPGGSVPLPSGAVVTLNPDGTLSYDPAGRFGALISSSTALATGARNTAAPDSFSYGLATGGNAAVSVTVTGVASPDDELHGDDSANVIVGTSGNDRVAGGGGGDTIIGGLGNDRMLGGTGDDTYFVDTAADTVVELTGEGQDTVGAPINYTLTAGAEVELLTTGFIDNIAEIDLAGNEFDNEIWGNHGDNVLDGAAGRDDLVGFAGNDLLIGGAGADFMLGGTGDDLYFVDNPGDVVIEAGGEGKDSVASPVSYVLTSGAHVELLTTGNVATANAINLTGNELANEIWGNQANNTLNGAAGADALVGFGGDDLLIGGAGGDVMIGGAGDDGYFVDDAGDVVIEAAGEGRDSLVALVNYTLTRGAAVELLTTGNVATTNPVNLTGNELANEIWGNQASNTLNGAGGNDILIGFAGADTFQFTTALGPSNVDVIAGFVSGQDRIALDDAIFTSLTAGALPAGAFASGAAAADANDRIIYNPMTGALSFDADGSGATAAMLFAVLPSGLTLAASDFTVI